MTKLTKDLKFHIRVYRSTADKPRSEQALQYQYWFLDYSTKDFFFNAIGLKTEADTMNQQDNVYFNYDYSPEIQRKHKEVWQMIKQLQEKNTGAKA